MDELKLKLSASEINSKQFQGKNGGYDSLQVDRYLDLVVNDYVAFEQFLNEYKKMKEGYIVLKKTCEAYKNKLHETESQLALCEDKLKENVSVDGSENSNIELLQRISALEQALYNLGKDPSKIK